MTRKQYAKLTNEERRIKVAEFCGYDVHNPNVHKNYGHPLRGYKDDVDALVPDYLNDLNAMHEAAKACLVYNGTPVERNNNNWSRYCDWLLEIAGENKGGAFEATAAQRAESLVLTMEAAQGFQGFRYFDDKNVEIVGNWLDFKLKIT